MIGRYVLDDDDNPLRIDDFMAWALWHDQRDPHVKLTEVNGVTISTVFLGIDMALPLLLRGKPSPPVLWETMVFNRHGKRIGDAWRYTTKKDAERGHDEVVRQWEKRWKKVSAK